MANKQRYIQRFKSYQDAVRVAKLRDPNGQRESTSRMTDHRVPRDEFKYWSGTANWEDALPLIEHGWSDGATKIETAAYRLTKKITRTEQTRARVLKDHGPGVPSVPRYLASNPRQYRAMKLMPAPTKSVKILLNASTSAGVSTDAFFRRGAALVSLMRALERANRPVELWVGGACEASWGGHTDWETVFRLKATDQRISPSLLAFTAHPAFFRRFIFALWEALPRDKVAIGAGYGRPTKFSEETAKGFDIVIEHMLWGNGQFDEAWVKQMLTAQGIDIK